MFIEELANQGIFRQLLPICVGGGNDKVVLEIRNIYNVFLSKTGFIHAMINFYTMMICIVSIKHA